MCEDKVSIIVPIYNSEKWLDQCINSVIHQTYENIELLLIDDGSTDQSNFICRKYQEEDARVIVINKTNGGVSDTRNIGLNYITGKYVIFLDSDDYLKETIIEEAIKVQKQTNHELIIWNHCLVKENGMFNEPFFYGEDISIEQMLKSVISDYKDNYNLGNYFRAVHGKLFLTEVIKNNDIHFSKDLYIGEDALFMLNYICNINEIAYLNEYGYFYRILNTSAVRRYKKDLYEQSCLQIHEMTTLLKKKNKINRNIESSFTVLGWIIYRDLLRNDRNGKNFSYPNAVQWIKEKKTILCNKNANFKEFPNITKLNYISSFLLSAKMTCKLTAFYMKLK